MNECEGLLGEIEQQIGRPTASPEDILDIVANLSSSSGLDDEPPNLNDGLAEQLRNVAAPHGGQVPLHGRLFAQWLHYAFPRECPFPHKAGSFAAHTLTPTEFGEEYFATKEDMKRHAADASDTKNGESDEDFMTQWSAEEELFADYSGHLVAPWERQGSGMLYFFSVIAVGALAAFGILGRAKASPLDSWGGGVERKAVSMGLSCKPHMV